MPEDINEAILKVAKDNLGPVVGIDLAGPEIEPEKFEIWVRLLSKARVFGLKTTAHLGETGVENLHQQFLPVLDNFELALKSTGSAQQLRSGVSLIMKQMEEILQKMQVSAIPALGESFDPRLHEALGAVERDDLPDQHVAEEIRRGYKIRERLLRPALVRVAHSAKQKSE